MAQIGKGPEAVSFARPPRGKWTGSCSPARSGPQPGKENEPSAWDGSGAQSCSKIPVLAKSRLPPDFQQLHQTWESQKGKAAGKKSCALSPTCKGDKHPIGPCADVAAAAELLVGSPSLLSRAPLEEIQQWAAAQKKTPGSSSRSSGKEAGLVGFVADSVAVASNLSRMANSMLGVARKPNLACSAPPRGGKGNVVHASGNTRTVHGSVSLYVASRTPALDLNPARASCYSRVAAKDAVGRALQDPTQRRGLLLKPQQIQTLSVALRDLAPRAQSVKVGAGAKEACRGRPHPSATAAQSDPAGSRTGAGDQPSDGRPGSPSHGKATGHQSAAHSGGSPPRTDPMGASQTEQFVPDPAALASILSNVGLSHAALEPTGSFGLARRVPVKGLRNVQPSVGGRPTDSRTSLLGNRVSVPPKGNFGRVSCRSVLGLKGIEAPDGPRVGRLRTPESRRDSPFGSARRVPITQPQSLRSACFSSRRLPVFPRTREALEKRSARGALQTPARWAGGLSPQPGSSDPDESALPWEKIVVRLFGHGESQAAAEASVRKALTQPAEGTTKAQRIQFLAQLLQKEVEGAAGDSSLAELHSLLAACAPSPSPLPHGPPRPLPAAGAGQQQPPSPSSCQDPASRAVPPASSASFPAAGTTLTFSSQRPVCSSPLIHSLKSPAAGRGAAGAGAPPAAAPSSVALVKQRLEELLSAPQRFQEACLDDECAFYTSRAPSSQPCAPHRCTDPMARLLKAQESMYFIPIPEPGGSLQEAGSSLQAALPQQPLR
ncbi:tastin isoform X1 [Pelodiscus sinensis]|uniref:tastin isoform X1 n=1 Tax=Pelodiscus sinensis TaxID=13735 RepID=UPI003F6D064E